jgi:gluconolactonase
MNSLRKIVAFSTFCLSLGLQLSNGAENLPQDSSAVEIIDPSFSQLFGEDSKLVRIADSLQFTEGPVWMTGENFLLFSDVRQSIIFKWVEGQSLTPWRKPSNRSNGNTIDAEGRLVSCESETQHIVRTNKDGTLQTLVDTYEGKPLNGPNDIVVKKDGTIWFTDIAGVKPKHPPAQSANSVFRIDPNNKEPIPATRDVPRPNGLCFSPDEHFLYVGNADKNDSKILKFEVQSDNSLKPAGTFATITPPVPDGMRIDQAGNLYVAAGDGIQVYSQEGKLLGKIKTPDAASNCAFGGTDGKTLFITARSNVWSIHLKVGR